MISGPPRKKKDLAKEVFEAAKELVTLLPMCVSSDTRVIVCFSSLTGMEPYH